MEFLGDLFLMMYDIDIHQLNLEKFRNNFFWMKFHSKNVFFCI
jgi:hypothetical protein